ncbi:phosphate regulon sensor histidine kinase PhoR [Ottowia sp.]|uniref:phosphate regulon sensor histidine kinase PhoR n=1 Tax=Ottowia sp. TaxID=1898956 RepID=UPI002CAA7799|nr:phosphate regulon sensor histidine kinase PhoR [Ottowia sp.]HOB66514.1 phosphate regulon sensor histidine kinase PhoR [Ottowia sp.]HPZ55981.1 phosphate regulon sensor histidine kinase PhoR [Ottowia sp.]HQD47913.1 phosphate regulon sensor histidine kinase PhoR [Ottowia sp.]
MVFRLFLLLLSQATLGLLGGAWLGWPGAVGGVVLAALLMLALDSWRAGRVLRWLGQADVTDVPVLRGLWGEAAYRALRALRAEQQKTRDSDERLREFVSAIQASPNGVILLDPDGRIEWCNDIAARHFGIDPQRDLLQHIGNLVREPAFAAYYAGKDYERPVKVIGREDKPGHPVKLSVQLHSYGGGHQLMLSIDVTALAQADAMRRDFVANVSHEIRTPLTVLAGFVETMQSLPLDARERERYLALMAAQSERMQTLVNDLLTLSRLEGSPPPGASDVVELGALMAQCEAEARGLSGLLHPPDGKPQQLRFGAPPPFQLAGAEGELRSAMSNLINNAVRYTPAGGSIDVRWEQLPDGRARMVVTDTGPGIAPEHVPRLGERFYRVDRSRSRESGGTGLGLAITKHVAQRHGGELQISSQQGRGSVFALVFPAQRVRALPPPAVAVSAA